MLELGGSRAGRRLAGAAIPLLAAMLLLALAACVNVAGSQQGSFGAGYRPTFYDGVTERIVVISAVEAELRLLREAAQVEDQVQIGGREHFIGRLEGHPVVLFLGGVSIVNATMAAQAVIDHFPVGGIVFSGIAGGVNPELAIGDVVVPAGWGQFHEMVLARADGEGWDPGGRAGEFDNFGMMFPRGQLVQPGADPAAGARRFWFPVDERMLEVARRAGAEIELRRCTTAGRCLDHQPRVVVGGKGVSGSMFVDNAEFRGYLWTAFGADAVDMESAAIAQVAYVHEIPFLAFRSLSDLAGGGPGANEIGVFAEVAAANSAAVLLRFLRRWNGPR